MGLVLETVDIAPAVDAIAIALKMSDAEGQTKPLGEPERVVLGNTKARVRAVLLRGMANKDPQTLVLGTENRTEHFLGYFTIGGDEQSDIEVLSPYYKTEVRSMAQMLGVPQRIIDKAPSADLWDGQTDEGELGMTYEQADIVLTLTEDGTRPSATCPVAPEVKGKVLARIEATAYKRADKHSGSRLGKSWKTLLL